MKFNIGSLVKLTGTSWEAESVGNIVRIESFDDDGDAVFFDDNGNEETIYTNEFCDRSAKLLIPNNEEKEERDQNSEEILFGVLCEVIDQLDDNDPIDSIRSYIVGAIHGAGYHLEENDD